MYSASTRNDFIFIYINTNSYSLKASLREVFLFVLSFLVPIIKARVLEILRLENFFGITTRK